MYEIVRSGMRQAAEVVPHQVLGLGHAPLEQRRHCVARSTLRRCVGGLDVCGSAMSGEDCRRGPPSGTLSVEKTFAIAIKWRALYDSIFFVEPHGLSV